MTDSPIRVLLVEDDEDDVVLTRQLLRDMKGGTFTLDWVADFDGALDALCADRHDVCLVDYRLGLHDGVEFVRAATSRSCRVPIILMTGQGGHEVDVAAMRAGAADYLSKTQLTSAGLERSIRYSVQQRKAEEQRVSLLMEQAARREAEAANQAKDQFLAVLSHELRTPLTAVLMNLAALERDLDNPKSARESVQIIKRNVELEARLIDDLLDLTRIARGKLTLNREPVDAHDLLKHVIEMCCQTEVSQRSVGLRVEIGAKHSHVLADPARLQQVFWNLIKNAVKFTPDEGRITIRSYNPEPGGGSAASSTHHSSPITHHYLCVEVTDTGIGIEPDAIPHIFNAFEQGGGMITQQFGGLGLGLAICKALVDLHGGTIAAASDGKGKGATFRVELRTIPMPQKRPGGAGAPSADNARERARSLSILLVEDHADTARAMLKLLNLSGHGVTTANTVQAALSAANGKSFDLLISDIGLPDGSGLELMRQLHLVGPIKGIALSGFGMEQDLQRSRDAGFTEHLTKPIDLNQLEAAIARVAGETPRGK